MRISSASIAVIVGAGLVATASASFVAPAFAPPANVPPAAPSSTATTTTAAPAAASSSPPADAEGAAVAGEAVVEDRRSVLLRTLGGGAALLLPRPASAGLLDDYGSDPGKISNVAPPPPPRPAAGAGAGVAIKKEESNIEPNLRSNYYYPTNKVRYLPRIKRCNDAIPNVADMIGDMDWDGATDFAVRVADDTILPMKLYTSSLTGGGTNVKVSFTKDMTKAANDFEKAQKKLVKALAKKDQGGSSTALEEMSVAMQVYRNAGRLTGPDSGGDIPSVDEIRRAACRVQGRRFEQKVKDRDARVGAGAS